MIQRLKTPVLNVHITHEECQVISSVWLHETILNERFEVVELDTNLQYELEG
jgi:hypothetical protein